MNYQREIANLPVPSIEQIGWFKQHLLNKHSWYKHLDLKYGNQFVIFLEPDLDRTYSKNHAIFPLDVKTKEQYLKAYGHLSYMWIDNNIWDQDGGRARSNIPKDLLKKWSLNLFPYCHAEFEEAISLLRAALKDESIPNFEMLVELEDKITSRDNYWNSLSGDEQEVLVSIDDDINDKELATLPTSIKKYILLERDTWPILEELRKQEEEKIDNTIQKIINETVTNTM